MNSFTPLQNLIHFNWKRRESESNVNKISFNFKSREDLIKMKWYLNREKGFTKDLGIVLLSKCEKQNMDMVLSLKLIKRKIVCQVVFYYISFESVFCFKTLSQSILLMCVITSYYEFQLWKNFLVILLKVALY